MSDLKQYAPKIQVDKETYNSKAVLEETVDGECYLVSTIDLILAELLEEKDVISYADIKLKQAESRLAASQKEVEYLAGEVGKLQAKLAASPSWQDELINRPIFPRSLVSLTTAINITGATAAYLLHIVGGRKEHKDK